MHAFMHEMDVDSVDQRPCNALSKACINSLPATCTLLSHMHTAQAHDSRALTCNQCLPHPTAILLQSSNQHYSKPPLSLTAPLLPSTAPAFGLQLPRNDPTTKHPLVTLLWKTIIHFPFPICQHVNPSRPRPAWSISLTSTNKNIHPNNNHAQ
jgi:hypothetical protein